MSVIISYFNEGRGHNGVLPIFIYGLNSIAIGKSQ